MRNKLFIYLFSIIGVQLVGFSGTFFTRPSIQSWYTIINKPSFNPPNWIFGPVWITLFLLIGTSLGKVLLAPKTERYRTLALIAYAVQLVLNLAWSYLFFYLHRLDLAAYEIVILLISIAVNIYYSSKVNKTAAWLLVPYSLWVSFATILSITIWKINLYIAQ
jgi:translocator protein